MWDQTPLYNQLVAELEWQERREQTPPGRRAFLDAVSSPLGCLIFGCIVVLVGAALAAKGLGW